MQPSKNNEPTPQHQPEQPAFITTVHTIPILKELVFEDCWQVPAPEAMLPTNVSLRLEPDQRPLQRAERRDPVCGSKGRRYFRGSPFSGSAASSQQQGHSGFNKTWIPGRFLIWWIERVFAIQWEWYLE